MPIKVDDKHVEFDALMVAGSVGMNCSSSSGEELAGGKKGLDTVAAQTGWWMFETKKEEIEAKKGTREEKDRSLDDEYQNRPGAPKELHTCT